jgi:hypothetical protein
MLSYRERLRFAWQLIWPSALIELGWAVFQIVAGVQSTGVDSLYYVASFFLIGPWLVRRAIRLGYPDFSLVVVGDDDRAHGMTYQESLKVFWLLGWRTAILMIAALIPLSLLVGALVKVSLADWVRSFGFSKVGNNLGLAAVDFLAGLALFPLLIPTMLRKQYRGFHLEVRRETRRVKASPAPRQRR